jgi:predicted glycosyl hydrolase (DUF1957 family)
MWLPEMAVDVATLEALAAEGIGLTMLSPHQVAACVRSVSRRGPTSRPTRSTAVASIAARCRAAPRSTSSSGMTACRAASRSASSFATAGCSRSGWPAAVGDADADVLVTAATDGETFGHHHHFGEMAVAYAIERLRREGRSR